MREFASRLGEDEPHPSRLDAMDPHEPADEPASSPCLMHEFADELVAPAPADSSSVRTFRKAKRAELLARRLELGLRERQRRGASLAARLAAGIDLEPAAVLGIFWPIRGEPDLLDIARQHVANGGVAALPVVVETNAPVEFWRWRPGATMRPGFWNIPVPAERELVVPDTLLIPLVGFDAQGYRLGYGGGYYDRTLAAAQTKPLRIGVGYADSELATIRPQPHDVPMSMVVTDTDAWRFEGDAGPRRRVRL